jgi:hypothetical protein
MPEAEMLQDLVSSHTYSRYRYFLEQVRRYSVGEKI